MDKTEVRLSVLEAEQAKMKVENDDLKNENSELKRLLNESKISIFTIHIFHTSTKSLRDCIFIAVCVRV